MRQFIISENTMQKTSFRNHQVKRFSSQRSTTRGLVFRFTPG
ncbi:hypothetical protein ACUOCP_38060, partial [Escherichia sp. R-CC3]